MTNAYFLRARLLRKTLCQIAIGSGALGFVLTGCSVGTKDVQVGPKISEEAVGRISIGTTTRDDLFRSLGPPFSIFQGPTSFSEAHIVGFYGYQANRVLTTLGEKQYGMLYRFSRVSAKSVFMLVSGHTEIRIKADELLLFLNEATHVVEEVAYRKDT